MRELWDEVDGADASVIESSRDGVGGESVVGDGLDFVPFRPFGDGSGDFEVVDGVFGFPCFDQADSDASVVHDLGSDEASKSA